VLNIIVNPYFNASNPYLNDLALLRFTPISGINTLRLSNASEAEILAQFVGYTLTWHEVFTNEYSYVNHFMNTNLTIINNTFCHQTLHDFGVSATDVVYNLFTGSFDFQSISSDEIIDDEAANSTVKYSAICAIAANESACNALLGSPFVIRNQTDGNLYLLGVYSWNPDCNRTHVAVFSSVPAFIDTFFGNYICSKAIGLIPNLFIIFITYFTSFFFFHFCSVS